MDNQVQTIGVGMIGCGNVGSGVVQLLNDMAQTYEQRTGARIVLKRILVRRPDAQRGCDVPRGTYTDCAHTFFQTPDMPIVIEVAGTSAMLSYVRQALEMGKHVVTANKSLLAAHGPELFALARQKGAAIAFEASCAGGVPIITALKFGLMANRIEGLYGILNGTCNYILTEMTQHNKDYATALAEAQQAGFAEADPTLDVSGQDTAEKLAILASLAFGVQVDGNSVSCRGIDHLQRYDLRAAGELGYTVKLLGIASRQEGNGQGGFSLRVRPCFVRSDQPLAKVNGAFNALSVYGHAVGHTMYLGRGAGQMPTASSVVSDLLNIVSGWYPEAFKRLNIWPDCNDVAQLIASDDVVSRYYLRMNAIDRRGVMASVTKTLNDHGISISAVMQHESMDSGAVPIVVLTHRARLGNIRAAIKSVTQLEEVHDQPACLHIVDLPAG